MRSSKEKAAWTTLVRCIHGVVRGVEEAPTLSDERAHSVRKQLKKARASLRVLRSSIGDATYQRENAVLRDASRVISPLRDAKAQIDLLASIGKRCRQEVTHDELVPLRAALQRRLERTRRRLRRSAPSLKRAIRNVNASLDRLRCIGPSAIGSRELRKALRRIYADAHDAFDAAGRTTTPTSLHEWRKKAKYLYNAVEILKDRRIPGASGLAKRTHKLGDWLGEEHDLVVLSQAINGKDARAAGQIEGKLRSAIAERRRKLRNKSLRLGAKTFHPHPKWP